MSFFFASPEISRAIFPSCIALAARRGKARTLRTGITKKEREEYYELLKILDLGLEEPRAIFPSCIMMRRLP